YKFALDEEGRIIWALYDDIEKGKLKDPRDVDSTSERWIKICGYRYTL
ncbi:TPA: hypothetical protein R0827_001791, partial [Campylobacter jejuni]|nr:hypothetical protein [Campylobacter jejuni]